MWTAPLMDVMQRQLRKRRCRQWPQQVLRPVSLQLKRCTPTVLLQHRVASPS